MAWRSCDGTRRDTCARRCGRARDGRYRRMLHLVYSLSGSFTEWSASIARFSAGGNPLPFIRLFGSRSSPLQVLTGERGPTIAEWRDGAGVRRSIPFVWKRLGAGYGLLMLAFLWLPLSLGFSKGSAVARWRPGSSGPRASSRHCFALCSSRRRRSHVGARVVHDRPPAVLTAVV
jgi:hypothetical protein